MTATLEDYIFDTSNYIEINSPVRMVNTDDNVVVPKARYKELLEIEWMYNDLNK